MELHDDASGYAAVRCGQYSPGETRIDVPLQHLTLDSLWLTSLLVEHALDAGAAGETLFGAELVIYANRKVRIIDDGVYPDPVQGSFEVDSACLSDPTRLAATCLSVDLSAIADIQRVARIASQLGSELAASFSVDDSASWTSTASCTCRAPRRATGEDSSTNGREAVVCSGRHLQ